mmetsp:Transcript_16824/g.55034  ORF Transcript_16824/g.55034 Transcript_16824/m.55034 type:complete len:292 (-) Transcript_16824:467-1342(-)
MPGMEMALSAVAAAASAEAALESSDAPEPATIFGSRASGSGRRSALASVSCSWSCASAMRASAASCRCLPTSAQRSAATVLVRPVTGVSSPNGLRRSHSGRGVRTRLMRSSRSSMLLAESSPWRASCERRSSASACSASRSRIGTMSALSWRSFSRSASARVSSFCVCTVVRRSRSSSSDSTCWICPLWRIRCMSSLARSSSLRKRFSSSRTVRASEAARFPRSFASSSCCASSAFVSPPCCTAASSMCIRSSMAAMSPCRSSSSARHRARSSSICAFSASSRPTTVKYGT